MNDKFVVILIAFMFAVVMGAGLALGAILYDWVKQGFPL